MAFAAWRSPPGGAQANHSYQFRLLAVNSEGASLEKSPPAVGRTRESPTQPSAPENLGQAPGVPSGGALAIQFDGPDDSGGTNMVSYAAMFRVAGTEDDWSPFDRGVDAPPDPDTRVVMVQEGFSADTLYELSVVGSSEFPPRALPGVVSVANKAAVAATSVSWVGVVDPGSSFRIAGFDAILTIGDGTAVHETYVELFEVFRGDDMSGPASEVGETAAPVTARTALPSPPGPPSQPALLRVSGGMATLRTSAPRDTGGVPLTQYVAFVSVEASVADPVVHKFPRPAVATDPLVFDVTGLRPRKTYDLVVCVRDERAHFPCGPACAICLSRMAPPFDICLSPCAAQVRREHRVPVLLLDTAARCLALREVHDGRAVAAHGAAARRAGGDLRRQDRVCVGPAARYGACGGAAPSRPGVVCRVPLARAPRSLMYRRRTRAYCVPQCQHAYWYGACRVAHARRAASRWRT